MALINLCTGSTAIKKRTDRAAQIDLGDIELENLFVLKKKEKKTGKTQNQPRNKKTAVGSLGGLAGHLDGPKGRGRGARGKRERIGASPYKLLGGLPKSSVSVPNKTTSEDLRLS